MDKSFCLLTERVLFCYVICKKFFKTFKIFILNILKKLILFQKKYYKFRKMSLNPNKDIVIGSGTFTKVVQSSAFIDKTNFIYEFLTNRIEVILTTAPRRFGKTVIMNMVKLFLEIQLDEQNKIIKKEETYSYKVFTQQYRNKVLNISTANDSIRSHLTCYPVIFLTEW